MDLAERFKHVCLTKSDINQHCRYLYDIALECETITEFGVRGGNSTVAFLAAYPDQITCYDINYCPVIMELREVALSTNIVFHWKDTLTCEIEETDLLFIDTLHDSDQIKVELERHGNKAMKYIVIHDTATFGTVGETKGKGGICKPIAEFVRENEHWKYHVVFKHNNGLTVLKRR